jgi:hypothetical protein
MNVTSIRRWHWMVVGLLAGALYGYVRESSANFYDELTSYGARRIGQREFEAAVTKQFHGKAGFSDLVITPHRLIATGGPAVTVHVVYGLYWDGRTQVENGRIAARWEPAYFVASAPYFPTRASATTTAPAAAPAAAQLDNVMAYLRSPPGGKAAPFEYSSWWWATRPLFVWTCAGFALLGGVWPTVVNLLAFGTFRRPAEAKGVPLRQSKPAPQAEPSGELDPGALEALERALAATPSDAAPEPPPVAPPKPAIRTLRGDADAETATTVAADREKKDYGKATEDFYPTELRGKHGK